MRRYLNVMSNKSRQDIRVSIKKLDLFYSVLLQFKTRNSFTCGRNDSMLHFRRCFHLQHIYDYTSRQRLPCNTTPTDPDRACVETLCLDENKQRQQYCKDRHGNENQSLRNGPSNVQMKRAFPVMARIAKIMHTSERMCSMFNYFNIC